MALEEMRKSKSCRVERKRRQLLMEPPPPPASSNAGDEDNLVRDTNHHDRHQRQQDTSAWCERVRSGSEPMTGGHREQVSHIKPLKPRADDNQQRHKLASSGGDISYNGQLQSAGQDNLRIATPEPKHTNNYLSNKDKILRHSIVSKCKHRLFGLDQDHHNHNHYQVSRSSFVIADDQRSDTNRSERGSRGSTSSKAPTATATMPPPYRQAVDSNDCQLYDHDSHNNGRRQGQKQQQGKTRRKSELSSFLTILFGSMMFILIAMNVNCRSESAHKQTGVQSLSQMGGSSATSPSIRAQLNSNSTIAQNSAADKPKSMSVARSASSSGGSGPSSSGSVRNDEIPDRPTATNATLSSGAPTRGPALITSGKHDIESVGAHESEHDSSEADANDDQEDGLSDSSEASSSGNEDNKLHAQIVDAAGSGADLILDHLKSDTGTSTGNDTSELTSEELDSPVALNETVALASGGSGEEPTNDEAGNDSEGLPQVAGSNRGSGNSGNRPLRPSKTLDAANQQLKSAAPLVGRESSLEDMERSFGPLDEENKFAMETYAKWRATADDVIELFSRKLLPVILEHGYDVDPSTVAGLLQVFNGIRRIQPWALKLLDASARLSPGILMGTQSDFGDFDECLNVRVNDPAGLAAANSDFPVEVDKLTGLKSTTLVGRYCVADVEFPKPKRTVRIPRDKRPGTGVGGALNYSAAYEAPIELRRPLLNFSETSAFKDTIFVETGNFFHMLYVDPIRVGICMTNKIDPASLEQVANKLLEPFAITLHFRQRCVTKYDRPQWTLYQHYSAYILLLACSLVCLSTLLDVLQLKLAKLPCPHRLDSARAKLGVVALRYRPLYTSFSLLRNTKRLFKPQQVGPSLAQAHYLRQSPLQQVKQFNLNLMAAAGSSSGPFVRHGHEKNSAVSSSGGSAPSEATTTSSIPDSSVESSPAIERRLSQGTAVDSSSGSQATQLSDSGSSSVELILNEMRLAHDRRYTMSDGFSSTRLIEATSSTKCATKTGDSHAPPQQSDINLLCLHGIRVITMAWMIVNHTYMFGGFFVLWAHRRLIDISEWPKSLSFQMVLNGWLTVETYFFLSALIIVLNVMPLLRSAKFNYFAYVVHRLLRLLPAYIGLVCLNFLWPLISSGPVWLVKGKSFTQTPCENYLWTNFLFINNWIWPEKQCMVHTWFLSADFQLYILAPAIVYLLYRRPALGHTVNFFIAVLASILSGFVIYANKLLPTTLINKLEFDAIKQQLSYSYFATYQHMGPYCLGILTGYLLYKRPHIRLPKHLTWLLWLLLPPLSFTTLLLTYLWNGAFEDPDLINPSPLVSAFYVAIHRTIWTALVAWLVFACSTGRAKLLSQLLSHSVFIPISRLSYSIYLVHLPVIMFRALNIRHTIEWTDQNFLWEACGNFVISLFMGYFLNIAFESPIINLENYISGRDRPRAACAKGVQQQQQQQQQSDSSGQDNTKHSHQVGTKVAAIGFSIGTSVGLSSSQDSDEQTSSPEQARKCQHVASTNSTPPASESSLSLDVERQKQGTAHQSPTAGLSSDPARETLPRPKQRRSVAGTGDGSEQRSIQQDFEQDSSVDSYRNGNFSRRQHKRRMSQSELIFSGRIIGDRVTKTTSLVNDQNGARGAKMIEDDTEKLGVSRKVERGDRLAQVSGQQLSGRNQLYPFTGNNEGDLYNISGEYRHYAPAGYQQWRMYNQGAATTSGSSSSGRPMQYATLARTSQFKQQDHHRPIMMLDHHHRQNRHRPSPGTSRQLQQLGYHAHHNYPLDLASAATVAGHQSRASFTQSSRIIHDMTNLRDLDRHDLVEADQQEELRISRRHRHARYNTLTGAGSRDFRSQYSYPELSVGATTSELGGARWHQQNDWTQLSGDDDSNLGGVNAIGRQGATPTSSWLQQGAMIPRVDSSTLRRQARWQADQTAASSIVEEHDNDDHKAGVGDQTSVL